MNAAKQTLVVTVVAVLALGATALADWNPGDPHKMHFPQLPDPGGWDVAFGWWDDSQGDPMYIPNLLADDWRCSEDGEVTDVHFWVSMQGDFTETTQEIPFHIWGVDVNFYKDDRSGTYSKPGEFITGGFIPDDRLNVRRYGGGQQGWYNPGTGEHIPPNDINPDHINIYQVNIPELDFPFLQIEGEIYWVELNVYAEDLNAEPVTLGWKTADLGRYPDPFTGEHFEDDAVWMLWEEMSLPGEYQMVGYQELILWPDASGISRDLAFVITPEPATLALLGLGAAGLVARRRRNRG